MQPSILWSSSVSFFVTEMMAIIHSLKCTVPLSFALPLPSIAVAHCHSLSLFVTYFHSLSLVVPLVVTRCQSLWFVVTRCHSSHSLHHSLLFIVTHCTTRCHSLSFVVTRCTTRCHSLYHSLSLAVIRCHSLSLDVPLACLSINDQLDVSEICHL